MKQVLYCYFHFPKAEVSRFSCILRVAYLNGCMLPNLGGCLGGCRSARANQIALGPVRTGKASEKPTQETEGKKKVSIFTDRTVCSGWRRTWQTGSRVVRNLTEKRRGGCEEISTIIFLGGVDVDGCHVAYRRRVAVCCAAALVSMCSRWVRIAVRID